MLVPSQRSQHADIDAFIGEIGDERATPAMARCLVEPSERIELNEALAQPIGTEPLRRLARDEWQLGIERRSQRSDVAGEFLAKLTVD